MTRPTVASPVVVMQAPRESGAGFALALSVLVYVAGLVVLGLLLPPFSLGERFLGEAFTAFNQKTPEIALNGLTIQAVAMTNEIDVRLNSTPVNVFLAQPPTIPLQQARDALPESLLLVSPIYQIECRGEPAGTVALSITIPEGSQAAQLDVYGYRGARWQFMPAHPDQTATVLVAQTGSLPDLVGLFQAAPLVPLLSAVIEPGQAVAPEMAALVNVIHPSGLHPIETGALQGALPALQQGYAVVPVIRNFTAPDVLDVRTVALLLQDETLRAEHIRRLVEFALSKPYQGLAIDYRGLTPDLRAAYTAFIEGLARELHAVNTSLTVVLPFPALNAQGFVSGAYDWAALGAAADDVQLLLPSDPQQFAAKGAVSQLFTWAAGEISRTKLQAVLSAQSVQQQDGQFQPVSLGDALKPLGQIALGATQPETSVQVSLTGAQAQSEVYQEANTPILRYVGPDGQPTATFWIINSAAFRDRLGQVLSHNLAGVMIPDLPGAAADTLDNLAAYKVYQTMTTWAVPVAEPLALRWSVSAGGTILDSQVTAFGTPFTYTPDRAIPSLQIGVEIAGLGIPLGRVTFQVTAPGAGG